MQFIGSNCIYNYLKKHSLSNKGTDAPFELIKFGYRASKSKRYVFL